MDECEKVNEYITDRGFKVVEKRRDFLYAALGGLYVSFWCPERSHIFDVDPLELVDELKLSISDALVVVAYRPYSIIDELQSVIDRVHRWYGRDLRVKIIGVSASDLEAGLEEAVGHAMAYRPFKIGQGVETGELCPNCTKSPLRIYISEKLFSAKYRSIVGHSIFGCPSCGLRIRRVEILNQI
ncbi:MAG: hypothetical protein ABWJ97_00450 [Thermoproteus sp.]